MINLVWLLLYYQYTNNLEQTFFTNKLKRNIEQVKKKKIKSEIKRVKNSEQETKWMTLRPLQI